LFILTLKINHKSLESYAFILEKGAASNNGVNSGKIDHGVNIGKIDHGVNIGKIDHGVNSRKIDHVVNIGKIDYGIGSGKIDHGANLGQIIQFHGPIVNKNILLRGKKLHDYLVHDPYTYID
jgi:hypothetical protein